jgi:Flp pilus assembly secretin CpaC
MSFSASRARALTLAAVFALALFGAQANERAILVDLDYARIIKLPEGAATLVIGNPLVADVTMLKNSPLMVVTGKSFGQTNLIVLDRTGQQVGESIITVVPANDKVVVQRGGKRESYACNPDCMPAVDLGDDVAYAGKVLEAVKLHDSSLNAAKR